MRISLIGPMGAGKTTVAKLLAEQLQWPDYDTDLIIEAKTERSISGIFTESGEAYFRKLEAQVLQEVFANTREGIIATGGGIVTMVENRRLLAGASTVIFLDITVAEQMRRLANDTARPLLSSENRITKLLTLRRHRFALYRAIAKHHLRVDDLSPTEVVTKIIGLIN